RFDGLAKLLTGALDLQPELLRVIGYGARVRPGWAVRAHRCAFSFTSWTSAWTPPMASLGTGGVALLRRFFPTRAAMPETASRAAPTMSAASHAATTPLIAMIAHARRQPTAYSAMSPLPANAPAPMPICLPFWVIS